LIVVVMGSATKTDCFKNAAQLLNQGFATNRMLVPVKATAVLEGKEVRVRAGVASTVPIAAKQDVKILVKKGEEKKVQVAVNVPDRVRAPITAGQAVGEIVVTFDGVEVGKTQALAVNEVQGTWWQWFWPF
jgi:D-alanyl-D-alanine carboxypeptidase (penicillin-binding protein 5/6)